MPQVLTSQNVIRDITGTFRERAQKLPTGSLGHVSLTAGSQCTDFANLTVSRVRKIENVDRGHSFHQCRGHIQLTLASNEVVWNNAELLFRDDLRDFTKQHGISVTGLNEVLLFHGTCVAESIAVEGFDFRLVKEGGLYGKGMYFSTQSCKSDQYARQNTPRTIIVSRIVLGNPYYAVKTDKSMVRPPEVSGTHSRHDSVIVKPGPMPGHHQSAQTHTEFVIFDSSQAYPEYIIEYTL